MGTLAEVAAILKRTAGSSLPALLLMTDEARLADPLPAANALPAGSGIILRHYGAPERPGARPPPRRHCAPAGTRPAGGRRPGARAAHRRSRGPSAGARHQARRCRALAAGLADHRRRPFPCGVALGRLRWRPMPLYSPRFSPRRATPMSAPSALAGFAALAHASPLPVYALGGIDSARARLLQGSGAVGTRRHRRAHSSDSSPVRAKWRA